MTNTPNRRVLSACLAGALMVSAAAPSWAAPVLSNSGAVKSAVAGDVIDVRWRGHHRGAVWGGVAAGLALGAIAGAAAARPYYYDPGYGYYGSPAPYDYGPSGYYVPEAYVAPRPGPYGRCWIQTDDRGFGYWGPC